MPMTFKEMQDDINNRIVGGNDDIATLVEIKRFLNLGQVELAKESKRTKTQNVAVANGELDIPSDCLVIHKIGWDHEELYQYDGDILPDYGTGTPIFWRQFDNKIKLFPTATGTADLTYIPRPVTMINDADAPELTDSEIALLAYAKWQIYEQNEDKSKAVIWEEKWLKEKAAWLKLDSKRNKTFHRVRVGSYS